MGKNEVFDSGYSYTSRNYNLRSLGFKNYGDYLASPLWKMIRARVFALKGKKCVLCDGGADEVHHFRYHLDDLKGTVIKNLHPVCRKCHDGLEFTSGRKCSVRDVVLKFVKARRKRKRDLDAAAASMHVDPSELNKSCRLCKGPLFKLVSFKYDEVADASKESTVGFCKDHYHTVAASSDGFLKPVSQMKKNFAFAMKRMHISRRAIRS